MWAIISAVILFAAGQATCVDVDFYSDATIDNGDVYDNVFVYDTPPDQTTVDMWGGTIGAALPHDSSTFNMYGGQIHAGMGLSDWSTVNIYDGTLQGTFWVMDSAWLNIYGGDVSLNSPMLSESSTSITEMTGDDYSHMNLVVIPEPSSLALLALGALLAKRRC
jgi:hypothetical protein